MYRCFQRLSGIRRSALLTATVTLLFSLTPSIVPLLPAQSASKPRRKVVQMVDPEYPTVLRNGHFEGQVIIDATVLPNGNVSRVDVKGGNPMLSQFAAQAVMRWKYAPGPDKTVEEVTFRFNANDR